MLYGDKLSFQNGFGAWRRMDYICEIASTSKAIIDVHVRPRNE